MNIEADAILDKIKDNEYVILLDVVGKKLDSKDFAKTLLNHSDKKITFIIGGAYGVSNKVKNRANNSISLSGLTFPHMLARIILLEQIYRAKSIIDNHPYHK
jgi:23S rRNA (pseudouridine1915-N3)-methyltransferase